MAETRPVTYYKLLHCSRLSPYRGWYWPYIGEWTPRLENISPCGEGYHAALEHSLPYWSEIDAFLYEVEFREKPILHAYEDVEFAAKVVGHEARLVRCLGRVTADCWPNRRLTEAFDFSRLDTNYAGMAEHPFDVYWRVEGDRVIRASEAFKASEDSKASEDFSA